MQSIKEILSGWTGSETTREMVRQQVLDRFGPEVAAKFNPNYSARTFKQWLSLGFRVRKNETALRSLTYAVKRDKDGSVISTFPQKICLFHELQVDPITN